MRVNFFGCVRPSECVRVCGCVFVRERERERKTECVFVKETATSQSASLY